MECLSFLAEKERFQNSSYGAAVGRVRSPGAEQPPAREAVASRGIFAHRANTSPFYAMLRIDDILPYNRFLRDDIHRTLCGDDIPLLSQWINKKSKPCGLDFLLSKASGGEHNSAEDDAIHTKGNKRVAADKSDERGNCQKGYHKCDTAAD